MKEAPDLSGVPFRLRKPVYRYHLYQGATNDCGPASLVIAANALSEHEDLKGAMVAGEMNRLGLAWRAFPYVMPSRIPNWATFPWGIVHGLRERGIRARWRPFGTLERLRRNLLEDQITIVMVGEPLHWEGGRYRGWAHAKVVFGHLAGRGFLFVDPAIRRAGNPNRLEYHGLAWQREDEFLDQWRNLLRVYVEVG
ncbi:MAG: hypothetical protein U9R72_06930 [Chloroflexota bacterium]|nr:hypothetical protein [Chloroflexota bacterium]